MDFLKKAAGDVLNQGNSGSNNDNNNNNQSQNQNQNQNQDQNQSQFQGGDNQQQQQQSGDSSSNNNNNQQQGSSNADQEDYLDKGIGFVSKKAGYNIDRNTEEKIGDGMRNAYEKYSGNKVPEKYSN
ncbi:hypothetical protein NQ176_g7816 [Zarea fungicola]|uniref:Uncharacterized protein n=1 Tax=Zarea fungicola TaxID=93591 RepID=A0ACC1MW00_9HYPO|nr:hypothetical protein NQ176_g7816 [Lecanicillium fungicola]